jgi:hypothetical protein
MKIVINDTPTEQVSDFQYLIHHISDYKNDSEDKLQIYNKQNGIIKRHFGIHMSKETKLIIHNITAKVAIKFINEAWVLKKRDEQRPEASHMKFFRHLLRIEKLNWKGINMSGTNWVCRIQVGTYKSIKKRGYNMYREWTAKGYPSGHCRTNLE